MNRSLGRIAAIALGLTVSLPVGVGAAMVMPSNPVQSWVWFVQKQLWPGTQSKLTDLAPERDKLVLSELEQLGDHAWAGVYHTKGKWPTVLAIAPEAGYTLYEADRCGNCSGWRGMGQVDSVDGADLKLRVELGFERPPEAERYYAWYGLESVLHLVRWGDLLFAVPPWRMELFCAEASDGHTFPLVPFRYVGDDENFSFDEAGRPEGSPRVPSQYERLIPTEPITGTIVSLVEWRHEYTVPWGEEMRVFEAIYSVDAGSQDGVVTGMRFYSDSEWSRAFAGGRVEVIDAGTSRVTYQAPEEERSQAERFVGSRVTTRHARAQVNEK